MLCDFYPFYEFQSDVCPPTPKDHQDNELKTNGDSYINKTVSHGLRVREGPAITEYILAIWVFTLLCEETRQVI
jgi:hypothetical protein